MPSLSQGVRFRRLTRGNVIATTVVAALIAGLFFVPQFVDMPEQQIADLDATSRPEAPVEEQLEPLTIEEDVEQEAPQPAQEVPQQEVVVPVRQAEPIDPELAALSPLQRISALIDAGYIDRLKDEKRQAALQPSTDEARASLGELPEGEKPLKVEPQEVFPMKDDVSWADIRQDATKTALRKARKGALSLGKKIAQNNRNSRYALLNFAGGITKVLEGGEAILEAKEVVEYLDFLDRTVTQAMLEESVDRGDYLKWTKISLGPVLQSSLAARMKKNSLKPFQPKTTLTWISVFKAGDRYGNWSEERNAIVSIRGYVVGKDVERLELLANGQFQRKIGLAKKPDRDGRRVFRLKRLKDKGDAIYTLRAIDTEGNTVEKSYSFYRRALRYPWGGRKGKGKFLIPVGDFDPRVDGMFRAAGGFGNRELAANRNLISTF